MKYVAILDSDDELLEEAIKNLKDTLFLGDENAMYCFEIASIKQAPNKKPVLVPCEYRKNDYAEGYNQALIDCGVI